jgi:hypothetical protein
VEVRQTATAAKSGRFGDVVEAHGAAAETDEAARRGADLARRLRGSGRPAVAVVDLAMD